MATNHI